MEFENLQIEVPVQEEESQLFGIKVYEKKYHNKSKDFVVGFNPTSKEFIERKAKRAKRFGVQNETLDKETTEVDLDAFNSIDLEELKWPPVTEEALEEMRNEAIFLCGVNDMSTKDVFDYFKLFGPETLEWIDDHSCNVVWDDETSMLRAMDGMSKTYSMLKKFKMDQKALSSHNNSPIEHVVIKEEVHDDDDGELSAIEVEDDVIDPKDVWRIGLPYKSKHQLFLRPSTIKDKKLPGAAQRSEYYLKYGKNPNNTMGNPGVLSKSRKRKLRQMQELAEQRFKTNEPDVKICDIADLKKEGLIQKMDVDEDEPHSKRSHMSVRPNPMTMIADREEIGQLFGDRYGDSIHSRLGTPIDHPNDAAEHRLGGIRDRLGVSIHDRLGKRNNIDARNDIETSKSRSKNNRDNDCYNYEDEDGVYHDVYRADHVKKEVDSKENIMRFHDDDGDVEEEEEEEYVSESRFRSKHKNSNDERETIRKSNSLKNRLGASRDKNSTVPDLRNKLRKNTTKKITGQNKKALHKDIKEENTDKVNLCIEIKQEVADVDMDEQFEF